MTINYIFINNRSYNSKDMESTHDSSSQPKVEEEVKGQPVEDPQAPKKGSKADKEAKKKERLAARQKVEEFKKDPNDPAAHLFGELELNRSQSDPEKRYAKKFTAVKDLEQSLEGQEVLVRARLQTTRDTGKNCFIILREQFATIQAVVGVSEVITKHMVKFSGKIPKESIVDVKGIVTVPQSPVETCSQKVEIKINEIWIVNKSVPTLPFGIEDASKPVAN
jgi:aspartyl-tRNA synthetase